MPLSRIVAARSVLEAGESWASVSPLFSIVNVSELRALLAHKFAHFYSGDTSLGLWVYRARTVLIRSFQNMYNLLEVSHIHILRLLCTLVTAVIETYFIFALRVTNFVSRKQEHRSDELACLTARRATCHSRIEKDSRRGPVLTRVLVR
jgi:heat shock protein HtpX